LDTGVGILLGRGLLDKQEQTIELMLKGVQCSGTGTSLVCSTTGVVTALDLHSTAHTHSTTRLEYFLLSYSHSIVIPLRWLFVVRRQRLGLGVDRYVVFSLLVSAGGIDAWVWDGCLRVTNTMFVPGSEKSRGVWGWCLR